MTTTDTAPAPAEAPDVAAVLELHTPNHGRQRHYCTECGFPHPCLTVKLLTGTGLG